MEYISADGDEKQAFTSRHGNSMLKAWADEGEH